MTLNPEEQAVLNAAWQKSQEESEALPHAPTMPAPEVSISDQPFSLRPTDAMEVFQAEEPTRPELQRSLHSAETAPQLLVETKPSVEAVQKTIETPKPQPIPQTGQLRRAPERSQAEERITRRAEKLPQAQPPEQQSAEIKAIVQSPLSRALAVVIGLALLALFLFPAARAWAWEAAPSLKGLRRFFYFGVGGAGLLALLIALLPLSDRQRILFGALCGFLGAGCLLLFRFSPF